VEPEVEELEGHFGNRIARVKVHLTGADAERGVDHMLKALSMDTRKEIVKSLGISVDEHSALFIRFDKQSMVQGRLKLGDVDPVHVKLKPRGFMMKGAAPQFYAKLLGGST